MTDLTKLTITEALKGLKEKKFSAVELTKEYLNKMESSRELNAYVLETPEKALEQAKAADEKYKNGTNGALEGIPLGIKDLFCTRGIRTTACSHILDGFVPPYESTVTQKLLDAGAVAANICAAASGTDTGGSIRQPSAFCGVTGIKPTYGRCSRYGIIAFASSLDQAGPIAKDVRDCAVMLKNMAGHDVRGMKIGIPAEYRPDGLNAEIAAVWDRGIEMLKARGADIVDISLPHTKYALATYYIIAPAEASSNLARYDGLRYGLRVPGEHLDNMYINSRTEGFGKEVKRRIMIGTYVLSAGYYDAYYLKAQKVRRLIRDDFVKAFEKCDVILTPTAPSPAFPIGDKSMLENPINMYLNDVFTVSVSLAGLPAMSLPAGLSAEGLPLGLQVIGKAFDEGSVFKTASALEEDIKFERK